MQSKTLKDLIQNTGWMNVSSVLTALYPDEEKNLEGYEDVFNQLKIMEPEDIEMVLILETVIDGDEEYVDVSGKHKYLKSEDEKYSQAIEFLPWRQWLGLEIDSKSLQQFSEVEILAHSLYEMTFIAFEEEEIQKRLENIKKRIAAREAMTEEERRENTISMEEFFESWDGWEGEIEEDETDADEK